MIYTQTNQGYILRFHKGDNLFDILQNFCVEHDITAADFRAIGAASDVELGYYNLEQKEYAWKQLDGIVEVASMTGNVAMVNKESFLHIHGVFSDVELRCFGGHINKLVVGPTLELFLAVHDTKITREFDADIGLRLCTFPETQ